MFKIMSIRAFKNEEELIEHEASMISLRIVSPLQSYMKQRGIKKKDLAKMLNKPKAYINAVFSGDKILSLKVMAKIQLALCFQLSIDVDPRQKTQAEQEIPETNNLKAGEVVKLISGGPNMVIDIVHENDTVSCSWFPVRTVIKDDLGQVLHIVHESSQTEAIFMSICLERV